MAGNETGKQDFEWFVENMLDFNKKYGQKIVAVKNKQILGVYDTKIDAINETKKTEELGTFIVQECFDDTEKLNHYCMNPNIRLIKAW